MEDNFGSIIVGSSTIYSTTARVSTAKAVINNDSDSPAVSSSTIYRNTTIVSTIKGVLIVLVHRRYYSIGDSNTMNIPITSISKTKGSIWVRIFSILN